MRLVLFDIDGTLITDGGAARAAFAAALEATYGYRGDLRRYDFSGRTDPQITHMVLRDAGLSAAEIDARMDALWMVYLEHLATQTPSRVRALPGVVELLDALAAVPGVTLALLTGNIEPGARLKLAGADLNRYFPFGAFGSDSAKREELPPIAVARAARAGRAGRAGRRPPPPRRSPSPAPRQGPASTSAPATSSSSATRSTTFAAASPTAQRRSPSPRAKLPLRYSAQKIRTIFSYLPRTRSRCSQRSQDERTTRTRRVRPPRRGRHCAGCRRRRRRRARRASARSRGALRQSLRRRDHQPPLRPRQVDPEGNPRPPDRRRAHLRLPRFVHRPRRHAPAAELRRERLRRRRELRAAHAGRSAARIQARTCRHPCALHITYGGSLAAPRHRHGLHRVRAWPRLPHRRPRAASPACAEAQVPLTRLEPPEGPGRWAKGPAALVSL